MPTSILDSVKKTLGVTVDDTSFDVDLIMHINSIFFVIHQLGIGPVEGFSISDNTPTWETFLTGESNLEAVKSYMVMRVKALFDPASTSFTQEAFKRICDEFEWRLVVQKESEVPPVP